MEEATVLPVVGEEPVSFIAYGAFSLVDPDDGNADRISAATLELDHLIAEIVYHTVDLLNHGLRQNFTSIPISTVAIGPRATR